MEGINIYNKCNNNTISRNNISNNYWGIYLKESSTNLIYFNDIYENQEDQAREDNESIDNQWDNGTVGNYWGDYSYKYPDARNNNVFWKTPYEIDGEGLGKDNYPLVNSISVYVPLEKTSISGFPFVNILIFISLGVFLLRRKIIHQRIRN